MRQLRTIAVGVILCANYGAIEIAPAAPPASAPVRNSPTTAIPATRSPYLLPLRMEQGSRRPRTAEEPQFSGPTAVFRRVPRIPVATAVHSPQQADTHPQPTPDPISRSAADRSPGTAPTDTSRPQRQGVSPLPPFTVVRQVAHAQTGDKATITQLPEFLQNLPIPAVPTNTPPPTDRDSKLPEADDSPAPAPVQIPIRRAPRPPGIEVNSADGRLSLTIRDAPLSTVLELIAQQHHVNIVAGGVVEARVSVSLKSVTLDEALDAILKVNGYRWIRQGSIIYVSALNTETTVAADVQGREVRVFSLDYVAAADVEKVVKGLLSPVGTATIAESSSSDQRRTRERIIIEDLPENLIRIECYIAEVDHPPLQVLIEARVLQVDLSDDSSHGVNFNHLLSLTDADISLRTSGLANDVASPAFLLGLDGTDLNTVMEALQSTSDAKTLAAPKVLAVNGQRARIQIGERFGYFVTTTTETSTVQNVEFLDVGVVLEVTPIITQDGQILMKVKPEVSAGRINPTSGLPEEETTEVETSALLPNGHGMIIGGLIQEVDRDDQNKIPLLGDAWMVGRLFQRRGASKSRREIVISLTPRIAPYDPDFMRREKWELERTRIPLVDGPLTPVDRRVHETALPDAFDNPRRPHLSRLWNWRSGVRGHQIKGPSHFFPAPSETTQPPRPGTRQPVSATNHQRPTSDSWAVPQSRFDQPTAVPVPDPLTPATIEEQPFDPPVSSEPQLIMPPLPEREFPSPAQP